MAKILGLAKTRLTLAVVGAVAAGAIGWVLASPEADIEHEIDPQTYLFAHLHARFEATSAVYLDRSLAEALPSTTFSVNGAPATPALDAIAVGTVVGVEPGSGYSNANDAVESTSVSFNSPEALWRTVYVTVMAEKGWGQAAAGGTYKFAVVIDGAADAATLMKGLETLGKVLVGTSNSGFLSDAPETSIVARSGALFGKVDQAGRVSLPVMEPDEARAYLGELDTVSEVSAVASAKPTTVIRVRTEGALLVRD